LAGALYAHYVSYINPESFKFGVSVEMVTMVVIGGLGSMPGGIVGSLVVILLPEYLRFLADYRLVVYGSLIISFMIFLPGGLSDLARRPACWIAKGIEARLRICEGKHGSAQD
jgi:branched-chain amino acid transport system permease protein